MPPTLPRLELDDMPAALAAALQPRVKRLGYLGEFFKCAAHQPDALRSFMQLTDDLKKALPANLTEVVALTVAAVSGNDYERNQHQRLCRRLGFADEWIRAASTPTISTASAPLSRVEQAVRQLTIAAVARHGRETGAELDAVVEAVGAPAAVAVLLLIGRYVMHALMVNALALVPPVASIFED